MSHISQKRRAITGIAVAALVGLGLSGCRGDLEDRLGMGDFEAAELNDPTKVHPIGFRHQREALYVELTGRGAGLSTNQQADVYRFFDGYKSESNGRVRLSSPHGPRDHLVAQQSVREVMDIARYSGIPDEAIDVTHHYREKGDGAATLSLSYGRPIAVGPNCGVWPTDLGQNRERLPFENFGCATQRNLAANVANARDLKHPQEEDPRSSERRSATWGNYVSGGEGGGEGGEAPAAMPTQGGGASATTP